MKEDDRSAPGPGPESSDLTRRDALKMLGAAASSMALPMHQTPAQAAQTRTPTHTGPSGAPSDPDLLRPKLWWTKVLTQGELATLGVLCDTIIPADDKSPSASRVGAPDYINEWVSAPYDDYRAALIQVRGGLAWLDLEAASRFHRPFTQLTERERHEICDDICYLPNAKPEHRAGAKFFDSIRDLTATAFYTTREGMKDLGYVGNVPLQKFDPPPADLLRRLGIEYGDQG